MTEETKDNNQMVVTPDIATLVYAMFINTFVVPFHDATEDMTDMDIPTADVTGLGRQG